MTIGRRAIVVMAGLMFAAGAAAQDYPSRPVKIIVQYAAGGGAEISGDPRALASALQKIHRIAQGIPLEATERHPETAQMMIMNPLSGGGLRGLFSTHPSTEERVERLLQMPSAVR